jgi:DHA1 family tetracycline resistance protein-like MFS transporter
VPGPGAGSVSTRPHGALVCRSASGNDCGVNSDPPGAPQRRVSLLPIFLIVLVDVLGLTIVLPLLPVYGESFGASALTAALLVPVYSACQLLSGPVLGNLSDRIGRRRVLLVSQAGTFVGFLMIAGAHALWMIFLGRILDGLTAGNLSVAQAYIADNTESKNRTRGFALIGIAFGIGFLLGPAVTAFLSRLGMSVPLYCAAGLSFTSMVCTFTLLPRDSARPLPSTTANADLPTGRRLGLLQWGRYAGYFRRPVLGGVLLEFFFYQMAFSMFISGFALFAERRYFWHSQPFTPHEIGLLYAFSGLLGILIQGGLLGRAVRVFKEPRLVQVGLWTMAAGYALLGYVEPVGPLLVAVALSSIGNSVLRPSLTTIVTQVVPDSERGVVLGLMQSLASLASISAAPLSGWLIDHEYLTSWGWFAAACCGMALLMRQWGSAVHQPVPATA